MFPHPVWPQFPLDWAVLPFSDTFLGLSASFPDYDFGVKFKSRIEITQEGDYYFYVLSNDGSQLFINNNLVVDNDGGHLALEKKGQILPAIHHVVFLTWGQIKDNT